MYIFCIFAFKFQDADYIFGFNLVPYTSQGQKKMSPGYSVVNLGVGTPRMTPSKQLVPGSKWGWVGPLEFLL